MIIADVQYKINAVNLHNKITTVPMTIEQQFQVIGNDFCKSNIHDEVIFTTEKVNKIKMIDEKTAVVYCTNPDTHEVDGPYEVGI